MRSANGELRARLRRLYTAKTDMRHARVRAASMPRAGPIARAVAVIAQERSTLLHAALFERMLRIHRPLRSRRVVDHPFAHPTLVQIALIPIAAPFPDIAGHVVETIAIWRE